MPLIHVPLTHGLNESVDPKLMPNGFLMRGENIRFRKDGRMGSRFGYKFTTGSQGPAVAAGNFGASHSVYLKDRVNSGTPAKWWARLEDGSYTTPAQASSAGTLGVPRRTAIIRNTINSVVASDVAYANGYLWYVHHDYNAVTSSNAGIFLTICESRSNRVVNTILLASSPARNPRIVIIGSRALIFYADTNNVKFISYNTSTLALVTSGTVVAAVAGSAPYFDVAPNDTTTCLLVYQSAAAVLQWGTVTTLGVYAGKATQAVVNPTRAAITLGGTSGNVTVVWADGATFATGNVSYGTWTTAGAVVVAATSLDASGQASGYPTIGPNATHDWSAGWNTVNVAINTVKTFTNGGAGLQSLGQAIVSRPFSAFNGTFAWFVSAVTANGGSGFSTYRLVDMETLIVCEAVSCQFAALQGYNYLLPAGTLPGVSFFDPRRSTVAPPSIGGQTGVTASLSFLPVTTARGYGADSVRIESGLFTDKLLPAHINGQLFFSGPRIREYDGSLFYESGLAQGPEDVQATAVGGAIPAGTYQYVVVFEWFDHGGRRHRSAPSTPVSITFGAPSGVSVGCNGLFVSDRYTTSAAGPIFAVNMLVYRTIAGGTIFYLVNPSPTTPATVRGNGSIVDTALDATIRVNEVLYTQGSQGGLSGLLPNDEPPPARFLWAGNNRLFMGGLEDPSAVQWSKLVFPGEPVQFSASTAFQAHVDGDVTAIGELDGTWYVFTRDSVWTITGDGPDDTGSGTFTDPRRLPSDVGCISQRSMLSTARGLFFQATNDRIYMIPRGGGSPQWVGQPVRDRLAAFPQVLWSRVLPDENLAVWALRDSANTTTILLIFDLRIGEWSVDKIGTGTYLVNTLDVYGGKLALNGELAETSAWTDDTTGAENNAIVPRITLGEFRPFGAAGWGRVRRFNVLGENRCVSATPTIEIDVSTDGGQSYPQAGVFVISGLQGDTIRMTEAPQVVRGDSWIFAFTVSLSAPDEGVVLNAISLEVFPSASGPLLSSAQMG